MCEFPGDWPDDPEPLVGPLGLTGITVEVTDNPVVAELLGPDGKVLRQWRERPPFGFMQQRSRREAGAQVKGGRDGRRKQRNHH